MSKKSAGKHSRAAAIVGAALLIAAGGLVWYFYPAQDSGLDILRADLSQAEPSVALRIRAASAAVKSEPGSSKAWGRLGIVFETHGFLVEAVACYEQAQTLDPADPDWPYFLGICRRTGDNEAAMRDFQRAAELKPDYAPLQVNLGEALARLDRFDEAEACYRRAAELDETCAPARAGLGRVALARGDFESAAEQLGQAVRMAPEYQQAHRLLAQAYRRLGDTAAAARETELAERGEPNAPLRDSVRNALWLEEGVSFKWRTLRAAHHIKNGQPEKAMAEWQQAVRDDPKLAKAHLEIGVLNAAAGRIPDAIAAYQEAIRIDTDLTAARNNLGVLLVQTGRIDQGLEQLRLAAEAMSDGIEAQFNYGLALQRANQPQPAVGVFRKVVEADPHRPGAYDQLGIALTNLGRFAEAIAEFKKGIKALPDELAMANRLAWLLAACPQKDCRNGKQAVALAQRLCAVDGFKSPILLDTLAAAHARVGDFDAAVRTAGQAIDLIGRAGVDARARLANRLPGLQARLELYKSGRPYQGPP